MDNNLSILIVDDHDTVVSGLKYELKEKFDNATIIAAYNIADAIKYCDITTFNIAIIDVSFKDLDNSDGIDLARTIKQKHPQIKVISYTGYAQQIKYIHQLQQVHVDAIVSKIDGNSELKLAIDALLLKNIPFYSSEVIQALQKQKIKNEIHISKRERDVIELLKQHLTYKEIANKLCISKNTVDFHAKNLYSKFEVHKAVELLEKVDQYL